METTTLLDLLGDLLTEIRLLRETQKDQGTDISYIKTNIDVKNHEIAVQSREILDIKRTCAERGELLNTILSNGKDKNPNKWTP